MKSPMTGKRKSRPKAKVAVFLVDDESLLLDLAEMALKADGYALKKFQNPELAYRAFVRARPRPVLLISDYAMGRSNGLTFLAKCKAAQPSVKTILVSGTVGPETVLNAPFKVDRFIQKPYQPEALAKIVRAVLAE